MQLAPRLTLEGRGDQSRGLEGRNSSQCGHPAATAAHTGEAWGHLCKERHLSGVSLTLSKPFGQHISVPSESGTHGGSESVPFLPSIAIMGASHITRGTKVECGGSYMDGMVETECWEKGNTVEGRPFWPCSHRWTVPPVPPESESSYSQAILGVPWHLGSQVVLEDPAKQGRYGDGPALNLSVTLSLCEKPKPKTLDLLSSRCPSATQTTHTPGTVTILGHFPSPGDQPQNPGSRAGKEAQNEVGRSRQAHKCGG